uniref:hypothetical protein n=1 Tax=Boseongicola sp. H5 TaxID=2763261 RepID=UPI001D0A29C0
TRWLKPPALLLNEIPRLVVMPSVFSFATRYVVKGAAQIRDRSTHRNNQAGWDIAMGTDGVALASERVPEELLRRDPRMRAETFLVRLDAGQSERLPGRDRFVLGTGAGGRSYLETLSGGLFDGAARLGVGVRHATNRIELGFDYTRCLAAGARNGRADLYEDIIRSVAEFANRVRCDLAGDFIAISTETNTSRGPVDRLHLVNLRSWTEVSAVSTDGTV